MSGDPTSDQGTTHYDVLGVARDADRQEIRRAYHAAMRRLHPDTAEPAEADADELVAVQTAWRVLGDIEASAAYDAELGVGQDAWEDVAWGASVGEPEPGAAVPRRPEPEPTSDRAPRRPGAPAPDPGLEPWRTPCAPGAVRVPEPVLPVGPPRRGLTDWAVIGAAVLCAAGAVAAVLVAGASILRGAGATLIYGAALVEIARGARTMRRGEEARAAAFAIIAFLVVCSSGLVARFGLTASGCGLAAAVALVCWRFAVDRRRRALRRHEADRAARLTAYHGAVEWNRIREALRTPDSHVERCYGVYTSNDPRFMRAIDPRTGEETIRETGGTLPRDAWLVVAADGEVLCTAPPGARDAWLACWPDLTRMAPSGG